MFPALPASGQAEDSTEVVVLVESLALPTVGTVEIHRAAWRLKLKSLKGGPQQVPYPLNRTTSATVLRNCAWRPSFFSDTARRQPNAPNSFLAQTLMSVYRGIFRVPQLVTSAFVQS